MKDFIIFSRNDSFEIQSIILKIVSLIKERGGKVKVICHKKGETIVSSDDNCYQAVIAVGGDGTMVYASKESRKCNMPVIGVHKGHLGYLCDIDEKSLEKGIRKLLLNDFDTEERMMISGYIKNSNEDSKNDKSAKNIDIYKENNLNNKKEIVSLNDVVITKRQNESVINLSIYVNGRFLYNYNCDGMIFATPTGSTAYNLSANGPIVDPNTKLILLNPINPHTLNSRTIVLDKDSIIEVVLNKRYEDKDEIADVYFDGENKKNLHLNEKLIVKMAEDTVKMIRFSKTSFLKRIRKKFSD